MTSIPVPSDEMDALRSVLAVVVVQSRTGQVGITHGMDRFVSTRASLSKPQREALDRLARRVGLTAGMRVFDR